MFIQVRSWSGKWELKTMRAFVLSMRRQYWGTYGIVLHRRDMLQVKDLLALRLGAGATLSLSTSRFSSSYGRVLVWKTALKRWYRIYKNDNWQTDDNKSLFGYSMSRWSFVSTNMYTVIVSYWSRRIYIYAYTSMFSMIDRYKIGWFHVSIHRINFYLISVKQTWNDLYTGEGRSFLTV